MRTWTLDYNGLEVGIPDVIWKLEGEDNLYLVMRALYLRSPIIGYSMVSYPRGQEQNLRAMKSVIFLKDKTPEEFQQMFHEDYPHFPLPEDIQEKYGVMMRTQLNFLKKMGFDIK